MKKKAVGILFALICLITCTSGLYASGNSTDGRLQCIDGVRCEIQPYADAMDIVGEYNQ